MNAEAPSVAGRPVNWAECQSMRLRSLAVACFALLAAAPAASAQLPVDPNNPPPAPAPQPAAAKITVGMTSVGDRGKRWVLAGERLVVVGRLDPFVAKQDVSVSLYKGKKRLGTRTVRVHDDKGHGKFTAVFNAVKSAGSYFVVAKHKKTDAQAAAKSKRARFGAVEGRAGTGSSGEKVRLLQILLRRLAYVAPLSGSYQGGTARGVLAFRKVNRMHRGGGADHSIFRKLFAGKGGFTLRHPKAGRHVEVNLSMAVLVLADKGKPQQIYHASPGKPSTPTVRGLVRFYRKSPGTNSHGMVHSSYFHGGYAIHGYASVPNYPASHGCIRVPIPDARRIFDQISLGETIYVYR
jgi:hypothetical protein